MAVKRRTGGSGGGGKFAVSIAIQAKDFASRVFARVAASMRSTMGRLKAGIKGIVDFGAKLGTVFATWGAGLVNVGRGIAEVVSQTSDALGALADLSKKTGISTTTLQELGFAAEQSGVQADVLNKSVSVMTRKFGEMQAGSKELYTFLARTGGKAFADQAKGAKTNEERLELMLGALTKITDEEKRAAFASKVFGEAGVDVALMAADGADNLRELRKQAHEYNVVVGRDGVAAAEEFGDETDKLGKAWSGAKRTFGVEVMRELLPMLREATAWIRANPEGIRQIARELASGVGTAVTSIVEGVRWIWEHRGDILDWAKALAVVFGAGGILGSVGAIVAGLKSIGSLIPGGGGAGAGGGFIAALGTAGIGIPAAMIASSVGVANEIERRDADKQVIKNLRASGGGIRARFAEFDLGTARAAGDTGDAVASIARAQIKRTGVEAIINAVAGNALGNMAAQAGALNFAQQTIGAALPKPQKVDVTVSLTGPGADQAQVVKVEGAAKITKRGPTGARTAGTGL